MLGTGGDQHLRVVVLRRAQHLVGRPDLDELAVLQHRDAVGDLGDDAEVVRDEQHAGAVLAHQVAHEREDLRLRRHVERRGRLVRDQELGVEHQRHRDHDALPLAARELVRIRRRHARRIGQAHVGEPFENLRAPRRRVERRVPPQHLVDLLAAAHDGIERRHRLLEDHRHARAAQRLEPPLGRADELLAGEPDRAAGHRERARQQAHRRVRDHALAGARFADEADDLVRRDRQVTPSTACARSEPRGRPIVRPAISRMGALMPQDRRIRSGCRATASGRLEGPVVMRPPGVAFIEQLQRSVWRRARRTHS